MSKPYKVAATSEHRAYVRAENPDFDDLSDLFAIGPNPSGTPPSYQMIVHGVPCKPSPDWEERHPGEAEEGVATYPYRIPEFNIEYGLTRIELYLDTGTDEQGASWPIIADQSIATNFVNIVMLANEDECWQEVYWIDLVYV